MLRQTSHVILLDYNAQVHVCRDVETAGHFDLFSPLLSCSPFNLYTVQFQFTGHSLDLSDNVLHDWLFPHNCMYMYIHVCMYELKLTSTTPYRV